MLNKKNVLLASAILSSAILMGCSSTDEATAQEEQKAQYEAKITEMTEQNQMNTQQMQEMQIELDRQSQLLEEMTTEMNNANKASSSMGSQYVVQEGDWLSTIAKNNGMTLDDIVSLNPQIKDVNMIMAGDVINVRQ